MDYKIVWVPQGHVIMAETDDDSMQPVGFAKNLSELAHFFEPHRITSEEVDEAHKAGMRQGELNALKTRNSDAKANMQEFVEALLRGDHLIPMIKAYRGMTGEGLKESKETCEAFREELQDRYAKKAEAETLGDILANVLKDAPPLDDDYPS